MYIAFRPLYYSHITFGGFDKSQSVLFNVFPTEPVVQVSEINTEMSYVINFEDKDYFLK
jgi:hypothetical protein